MKHDLTTVDFHGATLIAVRGETPTETLVAMKPVAEGMGLDWEGQRQRIGRHPVLSKGACEIQVPSAGGMQAMTALPLSKLNFWLATIQPNKVPNLDTRARILAYQEECADVLFAHFFGKAKASAAPSQAQKLALIREARLCGFTKPELQEMWIDLCLPATEGMKARILRRQGDLFDAQPLGQA